MSHKMTCSQVYKAGSIFETWLIEFIMLGVEGKPNSNKNNAMFSDSK